jgi:shikimate dehydrogenase
MTIRACIIGHPVKHSRSPLIHGHWLRQYGIDGLYERAEVPPEDFAAFIGTLADRGYAGGNVTVPHKEAAFRLAHVEDPVAQALQAVNLIWARSGRVMGANTDVAGFLGNLDDRARGWDRTLSRAVLLGAGGAARAVIHGLKERGAGEILVVNRSVERAAELAARFGKPVRAIPRTHLAEALEGASFLANATSLGMQGQPTLEVDLDPLPRDALVTDLVYVPLETDLLVEARRRGNPVVDGLGMLLHQAVPSFETWFGVRPQVTAELRALVIQDVTGRP